MSECFKVFYVKLYVHSLVDELKWFYENARCYNMVYSLKLLTILKFFLNFVTYSMVIPAAIYGTLLNDSEPDKPRFLSTANILTLIYTGSWYRKSHYGPILSSETE